jgi:hypothetical protein
VCAALPLEDGGDVEWFSEFPSLWLLRMDDHKWWTRELRMLQNLWGIETSCPQEFSSVSGYQDKYVQCLCSVSAAQYGGECWVPLRKDVHKEDE